MVLDYRCRQCGKTTARPDSDDAIIDLDLHNHERAWPPPGAGIMPVRRVFFRRPNQVCLKCRRCLCPTKTTAADIRYLEVTHPNTLLRHSEVPRPQASLPLTERRSASQISRRQYSTDH